MLFPLSASGCFVLQWLKPLALVIFTADWLIIPQLTLTVYPQVYKEDLPQLKKKLVGSLKRQKAPDEGLRLQFVHG